MSLLFTTGLLMVLQAVQSHDYIAVCGHSFDHAAKKCKSNPPCGGGYDCPNDEIGQMVCYAIPVGSCHEDSDHYVSAEEGMSTAATSTATPGESEQSSADSPDVSTSTSSTSQAGTRFPDISDNPETPPESSPETPPYSPTTTSSTLPMTTSTTTLPMTTSTTTLPMTTSTTTLPMTTSTTTLPMTTTTTTTMPMTGTEGTPFITNDDAQDRICGADYTDATTNCESNTPCPTGFATECPSGQHCFGVPRCQDDNSFYHEGLDANHDHNDVTPPAFGRPGQTLPFVCGSTYDKAAATCSTLCPSGTNDECPPGQQCFIDVLCQPEFYCGANYLDAQTFCTERQPCAHHFHVLSCPEGQICYSGIDCSSSSAIIESVAEDLMDGTVIHTSYCGTIATEDASNPWQTAKDTCLELIVCPTGECPDGEICFGGIHCQNSTEGIINPVTGTAPDAPTDVKFPHGHGYCGPGPVVEHAWLVAKENCSPATFCPDGKCPDGEFCYGGIICDKEFDEAMITETQDKDVLHETMQDPTQTPTSSPTSIPTSNPTLNPTSNPTSNPTHAPTGRESTPTSSPTISPANKMFCGPDPSKDHHAWMKAFLGCSPETSCPDGKCPKGQMCFPEIDCASKPTTTTTATPISTTTSTTTTTRNQMFCGPDPSEAHEAWMQASNHCGPSTACPDGICPEGEMCFAGIDCPILEPDVTTTTTTTFTSTTTTQDYVSSADSTDISSETPVETTKETFTNATIMNSNFHYCGPLSTDPDDWMNGWIDAFGSCGPETACPDGNCPEGMTCYGGIHCLGGAKPSHSFNDTFVDNNSTLNDTPKETPNGMSSGMPATTKYCGPDPSQVENAWMEAFNSCEPSTACPDDRCPNNQICHEGIICPNNATHHINTKYCGPLPTEPNALMRTIESCSAETACPDGSCPDDMVCYGNIVCQGLTTTTTTPPIASIITGDQSSMEPNSETTETSSTIPSFDGNITTFPTYYMATPTPVMIVLTSSFCGRQPDDAIATCTASTRCADSSECPDGLTCIPDITCQYVQSSFCGKWYGDAADHCSTETMCLSTADCEDDYACFHDIDCKAIQSSAFGDMNDVVGDVESVHAGALESKSDSDSHSNLRTGDHWVRYNGNSAMVLQSYAIRWTTTFVILTLLTF